MQGERESPPPNTVHPWLRTMHGANNEGPARPSVLRVFFTVADPNLSECNFLSDELRARLTFAHTLLLQGPRHCGRSSLAWTYCASVAAQGDTCLVLCGRARTEAAGGAPCVPAKSASLWQAVHIKFVATVDEVVRVLLAVQLLPEPPLALVVEDVDEVVRGAADPVAALALLLAALGDARAYCTAWHRRAAAGNARQCVALVSSLANDTLPWDAAAAHWGLDRARIARFSSAATFRMSLASGVDVAYSLARTGISLIAAMDQLV